METLEQLRLAKKASLAMAELSETEKNRALEAMARAIENEKDVILEANARDLQAAQGTIAPVMLDRLMLNAPRVAGMVKGVRDLIALPDPTGRVLSETRRENGLVIQKISRPMGVIGIIYESRPNVTSDAACLAVKSGSSAILRCGKEAHQTSRAIVDAMRRGLETCGLPKDAVTLIEDTSRESANLMMRAEGLIDLLIPRGGKNLIRACVENATVPCIQTGTGICHVYIDSDADMDKALRILRNAKISRPSVCNAAEVCLVARAIAPAFLPKMKKVLCDDEKEHPVSLRLDPDAKTIIDGTPAGDNDFDTEFLDYILAVAVVDDVQEACRHIRRHSTGHSEAIVTENRANALYFTSHVDSAAVYVNASTRFTDGGEFGLGCEMGISTQKLHARGPMGLEELCTYQYVVCGDGTVRE